MPLSAADLRADDGYRLASHRRHMLAGHDWGIVFGLALEGGGAFLPPRIAVLQPGLAVDGFGRELVVPEPVTLPTTIFAEADPSTYDVWLVYGRLPGEAQHRGSWDCGVGRNDRWAEEPRLRLTPAPSSAPDAWSQVRRSDLDFSPWQGPPDEPEREWPVFLGRIYRVGDPDPMGRLYASLRGETVVAASGVARLVLGTDAIDPNLRFAVGVPDPSGSFVQRIAVDRDANTTVRGVLRVLDHDLRIDRAGDDVYAMSGPCERQPDLASDARGSVPGVEFRVAAAPSAAKAPWNVYRNPSMLEGRPTIDQLSLETGAPEGEEDPARYRLAIGSGIDGAGFKPCLTVDSGCRVRIAGTLEVKGKLSHGPIRADAADPAFAAALGDAWITGANVATQAATGPAGISIEPRDDDLGVDIDVIPISIRNLGRTVVRGVQVALVVTRTIDPAAAPVSIGPLSVLGEVAPDQLVTLQAEVEIPAWSGQQVSIGITATGIADPRLPVVAQATRSATLEVIIT